MKNNNAAGIEMPRYRSHKTVWALKIKSIEVKLPTIADLEKTLGGSDEPVVGGIITPEETGYAPFEVDQRYMHKHEPIAGGYFVVYEDGYQSFSPAKAFEEGYSRI